MKEALKQISDLIERFERNIEAYHSPAYNETQLRREFIDPFFEALGWDVANRAGYAEQYKDVVHEDAIKVSGATKAPDYCFRMGGVRKFFLETKKPSVDIKEQTSPAYQLRRYAWSAKLPISILTDFEALAIYDCRLRPKPSDKPSIGRVRFYTYDRYLDSFEEIYNLLSKESVLKGSFDKFAESERQKRGTTEVDAEFLKEIESWRETLAKEIAIRNPKLSVKELNFAVQLTIDRIIFLRMCEDRGIEKYGQIQSLLNGANTYHRLREIFYHADDKYNSGLFDFKTDRLTPELKLDDKPLKDIFKNLYYPESPYEFSVLGADILGHVYEQFLGKVIRLTEGHRAKVEEKPEVRKAGGVYYTPTYIVDYIVKNTVGKICEGKTPRQISSLRVLDPACGSGSFLLGAYQYLLDYHLNWYLAHHSKKGNVAQGFSPAPKEMYRGRGGQWYLTIQEKKRILLNNIYGVDIDPQAVEVTKLSLLLKVLEGENQDTLERQMKLFKERALPDLGSNIKCGNSLIGPDFYQGKQMNFLDSEETYRINPFDWQKEFPEIMKAGGFDAVIGNPPWGAEFGEDELLYLRQNYRRVIARMVDSFIYFIDRAIQLLRDGKAVGFIVPSTILNQVDAKEVRDILLNRGLSVLISLGRDIFGTKVLNTSTILISAQRKDDDTLTVDNLSAIPLQDRKTALDGTSARRWGKWKNLVLRDPHLTFFAGKANVTTLLDRLRREHSLLESVLEATIQRGISPDVAAAHVVSIQQAKTANLEEELLRHSISGMQIKRYQEWKNDQFIIYATRSTSINQFPNIYKHLVNFKHLNNCKEVIQGKHPWWALHRPRDPQIFTSPKFVGLTTSKRIEVIYDPDASVYVTDAMYVFKLLPEYNPWACMAILQSKLFLFLYHVANQGESRVIPQVKASKLHTIPYPAPKSADPVSANLAQFCREMLRLHKQLTGANTPDEKTRIQRQIETTDQQIDQLVYELYGLTDKEILIIEEGTK